MTTAFQYVFDNAESISFNRRAVTAQTISRNNTVRTVSRGGQTWRFTVKLPDGLQWSLARPYIEAIDYADRYTVAQVKINNPGYNSWLTPYLGDIQDGDGAVAASWVQGNDYFSQSSYNGTVIPGGKTFRAGDLIQLYQGVRKSVYSVRSDIAAIQTQVYLNRAIIDHSSEGTQQARYNPDQIEWNLVCTDLPQWTIFARDQVSWSGEFVFYEALV